MNDFYGAIGAVTILLLSHFFAYRNGLLKERAEHEKEKNDAVVLARKARDSLCNDNVRSVLRDKYTRD